MRWQSATVPPQLLQSSSFCTIQLVWRDAYFPIFDLFITQSVLIFLLNLQHERTWKILRSLHRPICRYYAWEYKCRPYVCDRVYMYMDVYYWMCNIQCAVSDYCAFVPQTYYDLLCLVNWHISVIPLISSSRQLFAAKLALFGYSFLWTLVILEWSLLLITCSRLIAQQSETLSSCSLTLFYNFTRLVR